MLVLKKHRSLNPTLYQNFTTKKVTWHVAKYGVPEFVQYLQPLGYKS